ncbi:Aminopeptidase O [Trichoplax sp. H2]|nr:Aminopeptidase O [Trichoplax sp. H2]|eukprot:RDD47928.1 Aminopeptidase O [Trichoplax sp. H2]
MADNSQDLGTDLPLSSNVDQILIHHYVLNLEIDFDSRIIHASVILVLRETSKLKALNVPLQSISLDCKDIKIESVWEIHDYPTTIIDHLCSPIPCYQRRQMNSDQFNKLYRLSNDAKLKIRLNYHITKWSINIMPKTDCGHNLHERQPWQPRCICINYETNPQGGSLTWAKDQNEGPCVFSQGAAFNNRSLFPCQDHPTIIATWQASVKVKSNYTVVMSSNNVWSEQAEDYTMFHHIMLLPVPCSVIALAVGSFASSLIKVVDRPNINYNDQALNSKSHQKYTPENNPIICRIYSAPILIDIAYEKLLDSAAKYLVTAQTMLLSYPFDKLDIVVLPRCFGCLGLARCSYFSPCLIMVSPSLLPGEECLSYRLAHEICHFWFGILIGPTDWTEEWFSEGFATYLEDRVHCKACLMSEQDTLNYIEICCNLRYRSLKSELENTDLSLQELRPKTTMMNGKDSVTGIIKSALEPVKSFLQVHYLKGYFLLYYLSKIVGHNQFDDYIRSFVNKYCFQHVNCKEVFDYYFDFFPKLRNQEVTIRATIKEWLDNAGLPEQINLQNFECMGNKLYLQVHNEYKRWIRLNEYNRRKPRRIYRGSRKRRKALADNLPSIANLSIKQIILLLEMLLEIECLTITTLKKLCQYYHLENANPEIRHRWCELVIKHRYINGYKNIENLLIEDQGMGIYLYGELVLYDLKDLASKIYVGIQHEMDRDATAIVAELLSS